MLSTLAERVAQRSALRELHRVWGRSGTSAR
jgi:hypothetical protein